ncbi:MAG: hypothetical protein AAFX01_07570 [Cyanobacteria bacterium J06638_28]
MSTPSDNYEPEIHPEVDGTEDIHQTISPERVDLNQVYTLVDSILPFEACLYYQVLPLFIEGSWLTIGMVNLDDISASEYVKKQLSYINYSLTFRKIQSEWHRELLSKYLSHTAQPQPSQPSTSTATTAQTSAQTTSASASTSAQVTAVPLNDDSNLQETFIVDQPDEITDDRPTSMPVTTRSPLSAAKPVRSEADAAKTQVSAPSLPDKPMATAVSLTGASTAPLHLQIDNPYRNVPDDQLANLPPKALMQALLSKVLEEGIGRLYFESRADSGRILWSKDGVLQSVLEFVNSQVFQGVINELKLLTHLSLIATKKTRQVEIERLYENQRILLRFRVMPNVHGEEATLQVLRGTALKFYQQQQIDKLGRDALDTAQRLQYRLNEIRDRARQSLNFRSARSETLPAIIQLLKQMETQVQEMLISYDASQKSNDAQDKSPPS